jgi:hypothetical protein
MKREFATTLSVAAIAFTLFVPQLVQARHLEDLKTSSGDTAAEMEEQAAAMKMVPAQAALTETFDARKAQPGQQFRVTLSRTVQLKDGPALPRGTQLIGTFSTDSTSANGMSRLELRFTQAELKGGKVIPITATIVGVYAPANKDSNGNPVAPGNQRPNTWNDQILRVDQTDSKSGVELHSKIAGGNSGVLVSTTNDAIKLSAGSEIALAIAVQKSS